MADANIDIAYSTLDPTKNHSGQPDFPLHYSEVCLNDDAELTVTNLPSWLAHYRIEWWYDVDCANNWQLVTGVSSIGENTNEIGPLGDRYAPDFPTTGLCWKAIVYNTDWQGPHSPCESITTPIWTIKIIQPPEVPTIDCAGSFPLLPCTKCEDDIVTLTAVFASGPPDPDYTYQWLYEGLNYTGDGYKTPVITPTAAGSYAVIVYSKYGCSHVQSDPVEVKNCVFDLLIRGPCCTHPNRPETLCAVDHLGGANFTSCGGPTYEYYWTDGAGNPIPGGNTQCILVVPFTSPPQPDPCATSVVYKVKVTDVEHQCSKWAEKSIRICP
jgi:hypothetical protein